MLWVRLDNDHLLQSTRIVAVMRSDRAAGKRLLASVKGTRYLIELTGGQRRRSLLLLDSGHIAISALTVAEIGRRLAVADGAAAELGRDRP